MPAAQYWSGLHTTPELAAVQPQWSRLVAGSATQSDPAHVVCPTGQPPTMQPPCPAQISVPEHCVPQVPQFARSTRVFWQPRQATPAPPHFTKPGAHAGMPAMQISLWQTFVPHLPQLTVSF